MDAPSPTYGAPGPGIRGLLRLMGDGQRYLDLAFETLVALPLRVVTFTVAIVWTALVPGGILYFYWGRYLPTEHSTLPPAFLNLLYGDARPPVPELFAVESVSYLALGVFCLLTLPFMMRTLARIEAVAVRAGPGAGRTLSGPTDAKTATTQVTTSPSSPTTGHTSPQANGWAWLVVAFAGIAALAVNWPVLAAIHGVQVAIAMVIALAHCAALALLVRAPWIGGLLSLAASIATIAATSGTGAALPWPWPITTLILQLLILLLLALRQPWFVSATIWLASVIIATVAVWASSVGFSGGTIANFVVFAGAGLVLVALGVVVRQLTLSRRALQNERHEREEQDAQRRDLAERNRIARELHDVVAHSMSVISVQATTAEYRMPGLDPQVSEEFDSIAQSSRQALGEMRGLLGILRGSEHFELNTFLHQSRTVAKPKWPWESLFPGPQNLESLECQSLRDNRRQSLRTVLSLFVSFSLNHHADNWLGPRRPK